MPRSVPEPAPTVWYFGYGSNMDPRTFLGRRKMRPLRSAIGRVDGWRLCFDLPVGRGERAVANVQPVVGAHVWGVAHEISVPEAARLDRTEGVHRGYYVRRPVAVTPPDGDPIDAFTYHSPRGREGRKPSRRYMGLLLAGARHYGLPDDYVAWLRSLPLAVDERDAKQGRLF